MENEIALEQLYEMLRDNVYSKAKNVEPPKSNIKERPTEFIFCTPSVDETFNILTGDYIRFRKSRYSNYTTDIYYKDKIGNKQIKEIRKKEFTKKFTELVRIKDSYFKFILPSAVPILLDKKSNFMYDISNWMSIYFVNRKMKTRSLMCGEFIDLIVEKIETIDTKGLYRKILYVPLDSWVNAKKESFGITTKLMNDPLSMLLATIKYFPELIEKLTLDEIFISDMVGESSVVFKKDFLIRKNYNKIVAILNRFSSFTYVDDEEIMGNDDSVNGPEEKIRQEIKRHLTFNATGDMQVNNIDLGDDYEDELEKVHTDFDDSDDNFVDAVDKAITDILEDAPELMDDYESEDKVISAAAINTIKTKVNNSVKSSYIPDRSAAVIKKIASLENSQKNIINTIINPKDDILEESDFSNSITVTPQNKALSKSKFVNFDSAYNSKKLDKDMDRAVSKLNDAGMKVFVVEKEVADTSTIMEIKETYHYKLEDESGKIHNITVDIPKFVDDKYLYIGGNKKILQKHQILNPITKTEPDTVQICAVYKKMFIARKGKNLNTKTVALKKFLLGENPYDVVIGNSYIKNKGVMTSIEFDELAKSITSIKIGNIYIIFDLKKLLDKIKELKIDISKINTTENIIIGYNLKDRTPIIINKNKESIVEYIANLFTEDERDLLSKMKVGKRFMYSVVTMQAQTYPLVLFMLYCDGFKNVMNKAKVNYDVIKDKKDLKGIDPLYRGIIPLADDTYVVWDKYPLENSILLNAFNDLPLALYTIEELEDKDTYIDLMTRYFEYRNIWSILDQYRDFMMDPKTVSILEHYELPTDLVEVCALCNKMLANNAYISENSLYNFRVRSNDVIADIFYAKLCDSYKLYRETQHKKRPAKISMARDAVIKAIPKEINTMEDYSFFNPVYDAEKSRAITRKGYRGINLDKAYKFEKRAYDPTMLGVLGVSTSADAQVGVIRQLTFEPRINSVNGYIDITDNLDELENVNLFTPAELLSPPGVQHDDTNRTSMAYKQTKQMMPNNASSPVIVGNKIEEIIAYHVSNDFVQFAKKDGIIKEINHDFVVLEYADGSHDAIDIKRKMMKNSANGFYMESKLACDKPVGYKFKKNEILAFDPRSFTGHDDDLGASMNIGILSKVAILSNYDEYEDSAPITKQLALRMTTEIAMETDVVLNKSAFIQDMVKIGDAVKTGDNLIVFDDSAEDEETLKFLANIRKEMKEDIIQTNISRLSTKYSGEVADIKIMSTVPFEELSETLQTFVKPYYTYIDKRNKILDKYKNKEDLSYYKCGQIITDTTESIAVKYGKVKGFDVNQEGSIIILFYIKFKNIGKKGDKITHYTALKGVVSDIIEVGFEPYSLDNPDEEISALIAPGAVLARKTPSIFLAMFSNKVMIRLTEQLRDFWLNN